MGNMGCGKEDLQRMCGWKQVEPCLREIEESGIFLSLSRRPI